MPVQLSCGQRRQPHVNLATEALANIDIRVKSELAELHGERPGSCKG
jgi:hypothetical protein